MYFMLGVSLLYLMSVYYVEFNYGECRFAKCRGAVEEDLAYSLWPTVTDHVITSAVPAVLVLGNFVELLNGS
jgi:hypothetical protein